jgi:hypothetical protein
VLGDTRFPQPLETETSAAEDEVAPPALLLQLLQLLHRCASYLDRRMADRSHDRTIVMTICNSHTCGGAYPRQSSFQ